MANHVIIIAEAGVNHNGDFNMAMQLIDAAAQAGADYVKFQTFKADKLASKQAPKADYQARNINDSDNSQYQMLKKLEMPEEWHYKLKEYAQQKSIGFLSTGFDEESIDFLETLGIDIYKIPSGEITNKPYLQHIGRKGKPVILSTGMADIDEVEEALNVLLQVGLPKSNITVLHCNTEYPTPMGDVNLLAMNEIGLRLGVKIGYSDHTLGIEVPIAAVTLGASVIEKHYTLDKNLPGPDHRASLEPKELCAMVTAIRNIEQAISGSGKKTPSQSEIPNKYKGRKSIHYKQALTTGTKIKAEHLIMLRPGTGISPMQIDTFIGKTLTRNVDALALMDLNDF
ncbi:MAG TPA: N-acetylneuraminate synthase [Chitinophagales bacterium]|nr:N-acetylneuraminate synthase [Chitinophagales bacterium]